MQTVYLYPVQIYLVMASKLTNKLQLTLALIKPDVMVNPLIMEVVTSRKCHGYLVYITLVSRFASFYLAYSHTYCHTYHYWYSFTHSLFHSRLQSFLFCKSSLPQPFLFLLQDSLYRFPRLFAVTSEHIFLLFSFFSVFLHFFSCRFRAVD